MMKSKRENKSLLYKEKTHTVLWSVTRNNMSQVVLSRYLSLTTVYYNQVVDEQRKEESTVLSSVLLPNTVSEYDQVN